VAASHPLANDFDQAQYDAGTGPCVDAATTGHTVHGHPASETSPWPALRETARQARIQAVLSTPFGHDTAPIGALNLYALGLDFTPADGELAAALVDESARVLAVAEFDRVDLSERLRAGLAGRDRIARAQGIMMERHDLSASQAYTRLLHDATNTGTFLDDTAERVIDDSGPPDSTPLGGDGRE
jgi:hypothetical protein